MKILNLYAGIGGNRKLWGDEHEVTAIEIEPEIAEAYKYFFPNDNVIIGDAHKYLLEHYKEFDFIWSSPPCPSHSVRGMLTMKYGEKVKEQNLKKKGGTKEVEFPDMKLYQEIILLKHFFKGKWVIENTKSYYEPLIKPQISGNHYFWANFIIGKIKLKSSRAVSVTSIKEKEKKVGFNLKDFNFKNIKDTHKKDKVLNNCTEPELGFHIFKCAFKEKQERL